MRLLFTTKALKQYRDLPSHIHSRAKKQFQYLLADRKHPSLHTKKYDEKRELWQGRITRDYRFYFLIEGDTYVIIALTRHPK